MKLYAVEYDEQDSYNIEAIFSNKDEAQKVVDWLSKYSCWYGIREFEIFNLASDYLGDFYEYKEVSDAK